LYTLAVISDIHANLEAYEAVMEHISVNFPEVEILCPGDLVGYGPKPREVIEAILSNQQILAITKGNHDHAIGGGGRDLKNIDTYVAKFNPLAQIAIRWQVSILSEELKTFLYQLPHTRTCLHHSEANAQIGIIHGSPNFPLDEYILPKTSAQMALFPFMQLIEINILLLGHTHIPFIDKATADEKELLMINPGSVGQPRDKDPRASYAVIDLKNMTAEIIRVDYDVDKVNDQIIEAGLPDFLGERLSKGI
jgi:putative phosphoesterase